MKRVAVATWRLLYAQTWTVFVELMLVLTPGHGAWLLSAHAALGLVILALAIVNEHNVRVTSIAGRVKRTARSTVQLSLAMVALGLLLWWNVGGSLTLPLGLTVPGIVAFAHAVVALAIFAEAAATGIAYDMWEEREFAEVTPEGEVPGWAEDTSPGRRSA